MFTSFFFGSRSLCPPPISFYFLLLDFLLLSSPLSFPHNWRLSGSPPQTVISQIHMKQSDAHSSSISCTHTQTHLNITNSIHNDTHKQSNTTSSAQCSSCLSILPYFIVEFYFLPFVVLHIIRVHACLLKLFLFMFCVLALVVSSLNNCLPKHVKNWVKAATHKFKSEPLNGLDTALYSLL